MSESGESPFLQLLRSGIEAGGFSTDDAIALVLPLFRQIREAHHAGMVAPLSSIAPLRLNDSGGLALDPLVFHAPKNAIGKIERLESPESKAFEIMGRRSQTVDLSEGTVDVENREISNPGDELVRPAFIPAYASWEHVVGHHDALTDIFCLGQILASIVCRLDFTDLDDFDRFVAHRNNLFALVPHLHPVIGRLIEDMTALSRPKRSRELGAVIGRLENYRDQPDDFDVNEIDGVVDAPPATRRRLIQEKLRERLFEISRRNRLIHFRSSQHTINLTIASVPPLLDVRNIQPDQLFYWHPALAEAIGGGCPVSLGRYLRFEDAPYLTGALDKIISEARRDQAEYGFAQLRLIVAFLRWHNLKENPEERIESPLLLLPVELKKKKGVRDSYILEPTSTEAEVNPALRHHLRQLYNLVLPAVIDLRSTSLATFHAQLAAQIKASEPGVSLHLVEKPQIDLVQEKARQRLEQFHKKQKLTARRSSRRTAVNYSYERDDYRPLGLQLFLSRVKPTPIGLRIAAGGTLPPQPQFITAPTEADSDGPTNVVETSQQAFALKAGGTTGNRYSWDFDVCSLTLGNFNYRRMSLVHDYDALLDDDRPSAAFDTVFASTPRTAEVSLERLPLAEQFTVVPGDATQLAAINRARSGASYIIQGPPGTGKSQTITNLIADFIARGKRVLFVCEKRAAIDVVFHRLRQQGLDPLCCLIHDSQTDKRAFIQNLKQTYESLLAESNPDEREPAEQKRAATLQRLQDDVVTVERLSTAMTTHQDLAGCSARELIDRMLELREKLGEVPSLTAEQEELLPDYAQWSEHAMSVQRLSSALVALGEPPQFAVHPFRWLGSGVLETDRPIAVLRELLDEAEATLESFEAAVELSGLPSELADTLGELTVLAEFSIQIQYLTQRHLLPLLNPKSEGSRQLASSLRDMDEQAKRLKAAQEQASGWRDPLSPTDVSTALSQARDFESAFLRFLHPGWYRLKKTLGTRYDMARHAVRPAWSQALEWLAAAQSSEAEWRAAKDKLAAQLAVEDPHEFANWLNTLRSWPTLQHPSVRALHRQLLKNADTGHELQLVDAIASLQDDLTRIVELLRRLLTGHDELNLETLGSVLKSLREHSAQLPDLVDALRETAVLPPQLLRSLRELPLQPDAMAFCTAHRTLVSVWRDDPQARRITSSELLRRMENFSLHHRDLLSQNATCIRERVRRQFLEHVRISALPAGQFTSGEKAFKKIYASGRRELEHEFTKTMRYRSIRDLANGEPGMVIRDLKPVWLMSPLSVSDTLPLDPDLFDVVIFDEASQVPVEEAIPAIFRAPQVIVVGDEMQLPPTSFFATAREDESDEVLFEEDGEPIAIELNADSFLTQSARNLPSTLLAWHYRSRSESLIGFSNAAFYSGQLYTVPDRKLPTPTLQEIRVESAEDGGQNCEALLQRSVSFHHIERGQYNERRNSAEARYIAEIVRELLRKETGLSIGIVAFSEAQQQEIESALERLAEEDADFAARLEAESIREEDDQFCGLIIKNLENVQGDERDIIILSICYGRGADGRMLMNFGPINQRGGEKRLNVIFSRSKHHMVVVSSIRHGDITNDWNDGALALKRFLRYAEYISRGEIILAQRVLEEMNVMTRQAQQRTQTAEPVIDQLAAALRNRGLHVDTHVGQSRFRCDLALRDGPNGDYRLAIQVDSQTHYANPDIIERHFGQPGILQAFGWKVLPVLAREWLDEPDAVLLRIIRAFDGTEDITPIIPEPSLELPKPPENSEPSRLDHSSSHGANSVQPPIASQPSAPTESSKSRYFEFIDGNSRKFWEITVVGAALTVRFGRIGTSGQQRTKTFSDFSATEREFERLILEKSRKGYAEKPIP